MARKPREQKNPNEKLELAQKIADNSQKVVNTYANVENTVISFFRWIAGGLNKLVFDSKFSSLAALIIAVILYISVNADSSSAINVTQASQINDIPVQVIYNSVIYELSEIPTSANVIVMGDMSDITLQKSQQNSRLTCDLSGLTEGTYTVKLTPTNFISRLDVNVIDTPSVTVTIKKKVTTTFNASYDFINTNQMDKTFTLSEPVFDQTEVIVRASQDTIDSIAFVKALIDVANINGSFTKEAKLVAYNQKGELVKCDFIPETLTATVEVSSPSKEVPIIVRPIGTLPNNLAIEDIVLDYSTVTIYASENILSLIDAFYIDLDVSQITKNTVVSTALTVPSGASSISVTKVNMEITVGTMTSKVIEGIDVQYFNYSGEYKFSPTNPADVSLNVRVSGTEKNITGIDADDIIILMDLKDIKPGVQQVPIIINSNLMYVTFQIDDGRTAIEIQVIE